jgi:quinol monooxygenase YgiN
MATAVIDPDVTVTTLINVFTVEPARQDELVALLDEATEAVMRHRPGFVSANIHASLDGTRVENYAQWESEEAMNAMNAMLADPACREHMGGAAALAGFEPHLYRVCSTHR